MPVVDGHHAAWLVPALSTPGAAATIEQTANEGRPELSGKGRTRIAKTEMATRTMLGDARRA